MKPADILSPVKMNALELSKHSIISTMSILSLWKRPIGQNDAMQKANISIGTPTTPERKTKMQEKYVIHTVCIFLFDTYLEIVIYTNIRVYACVQYICISLEIKYFAGKPSGQCWDTGDYSVQDRERCHDASGKIENVPDARLFGVTTNPHMPTGCYLDTKFGGKRMYFNKHIDGHRNHEARPICEDNST